MRLSVNCLEGVCVGGFFFDVNWLFLDVSGCSLEAFPPPQIIHDTIMSLALDSTAPDNRFGVSLSIDDAFTLLGGSPNRDRVLHLHMGV